MPNLRPAALVLLAAPFLVHCSDDDDVVNPVATPDAGASTPQSTACVPDESAPVPAARCTNDPADTTKPACNTWVKVEPPGAVCGDGSPFKFFVNYSDQSNDLAIEFEPGGACWDYESCSGEGTVRGAANPHGIPDDHMTDYQYLNLLRRTADNPAQKYNLVFVSYCTGDIHTGNNVMTYTSATDPAKTLEFHHAGHANSEAVIAWVKQAFPVVPKLLVTGCSAGGAGAILNYHSIRRELGATAQCGYLLDDSGPIFHSNGPSKPLQDKIRSAWNVDPVLDALASDLPVDVAALKSDFGLLNTAIARKYPKDRLSLVAYRLDFNFSLYSYQRFFPGSTEAQIHAMWWQDLQGLITTYQAEPNLAYYLPYFRSDNCSHCVSIPPLANPPLEPTDVTKVLTQPWLGSGIAEDGLDLKQFSTDLLNDQVPLKSYLESVQGTEMFTPAESAQCLQGG